MKVLRDEADKPMLPSTEEVQTSAPPEPEPGVSPEPTTTDSAGRHVADSRQPPPGTKRDTKRDPKRVP